MYSPVRVAPVPTQRAPPAGRASMPPVKSVATRTTSPAPTEMEVAPGATVRVGDAQSVAKSARAAGAGTSRRSSPTTDAVTAAAQVAAPPADLDLSPTLTPRPDVPAVEATEPVGCGIRDEPSEVVLDHQRGVVREALRVRRRPVDGRSDRGVGQVRRRQLVVDAPARVVVERLPAPRPPRERPRPLAAELSAQVVPAEVVEPAVQVRAL